MYIEILDFQDNSHKVEKQTAYLAIPFSFIIDFQNIYKEIEISIKNTKKKDRKKRKELCIAH